MTLDDVVDVLSKCAAFDRRTVGEADAIAWADAIGDLPCRDALDAVAAWYRDHREFVMPSDIRTLVEDIQGARAERVSDEDLTQDVDPRDGRAYLATLQLRKTAIRDGMTVDQANALPLPPEARHAAIDRRVHRVLPLEGAR